MVLAKPHILSGMELGSALADDNGTGLGDLITKDFDAKPLAFRIAAILGASSSFLVCTLDG